MTAHYDNETKESLVKVVHRVYEVRLEKGISARALAAKAKINYQTIAQAESYVNFYSLATLIRLSKALNKPLSELLIDL